MTFHPLLGNRTAPTHPQFAKIGDPLRMAAVFSALTLTITACDDAGHRQDTFVWHNPSGSFPKSVRITVVDPWDAPGLYHRAPCKLQARPSESPSDLEFDSFRRRVDMKKGTVIMPTDIRCIAKFYSKDSARRWSSRGDPIATYIYLFKEFPHISDICANIDHISSKLIEGSQKESTLIVGGARVKRAPELYYLSLDLRATCKSGGFVIHQIGPDKFGFDPWSSPDHQEAFEE